MRPSTLRYSSSPSSWRTVFVVAPCFALAGWTPLAGVVPLESPLAALLVVVLTLALAGFALARRLARRGGDGGDERDASLEGASGTERTAGRSKTGRESPPSRWTRAIADTELEISRELQEGRLREHLNRARQWRLSGGHREAFLELAEAAELLQEVTGGGQGLSFPALIAPEEVERARYGGWCPEPVVLDRLARQLDGYREMYTATPASRREAR